MAAIRNQNNRHIYGRILSFVLDIAIDDAGIRAHENLERTCRLAIEAQSFVHDVHASIPSGLYVGVPRHSSDADPIVIAAHLLQCKGAIGLDLGSDRAAGDLSGVRSKRDAHSSYVLIALTCLLSFQPQPAWQCKAGRYHYRNILNVGVSDLERQPCTHTIIAIIQNADEFVRARHDSPDFELTLVVNAAPQVSCVARTNSKAA